MTSDAMKIAGVITLVAAVVIGAIYWEISLWSECRTDHSFWYCLRVLGR